MLIIMDWHLALTCALFFVISFAYGWGLLFFFRDKFSWSLASVVGIASVVIMTYILIWQLRGLGNDSIQPVYDLALVFLSALPGMAWVDFELRTDNGQKVRIRELLKEQKETKEMLREVLFILGMRDEAMEYLKRYRQEINKN